MAGGLGSSVGSMLYGNAGYNSAPIDQGTKDLINQQVSNAQGQSSGFFASKDLQGTNQDLDTTGVQNYHNALGGNQDPNMQAALQARAQRSMNSGVNQLQRQAQVQGIGQANTQLQNAFGDVTGQQQSMNAANAAQVQAYQNNQATRSSIVSGLFGSAGGIAGMMGGGSGGGGMNMPNGSVAGDSNNFGAGSYSQPEMGSQFGGGAASLFGGD